MKLILLLLSVCVIMGCSSQKAETAKVEPPAKLEHMEAVLISEITAIQPGTPFWVAVKFDLEEDWHINWKNPGDAGLAPTIEWVMPEGFTAGEINWPNPARISTPPFILFGYEDRALLPVQITPPKNLRNGDKVTLTAKTDWVVCGDVCVPGSAELSLELPVKSSDPVADSKWESEFASFRNKSAIPNDLMGLALSYSENSITISASPKEGNFPAIESLTFFPEEQGIINNAADQKLSQKGSGYALEIPRDKMVQNLPEYVKGLLVVKSPQWTPSKRVYSVEMPLIKKSGS